MTKKIVLFTVTVLSTFLSGCQSNLKFKMNTSASGFAPNFGLHNTENIFANNFSEAFNSLFYTPEKEEKKDDKKPEVEISNYDALIKRISKDYGYDWRFLSSIAYNESRFNPRAVSRVGAKGIMQIMPIVEREFEAEGMDVFDPEHNITLAAKLLKSLERRLKLPSSVDEQNKQSLILACYNGGIGHVSDARRLARKHGKNPNSWEDVAHFLKMKANEEYHTDEVVWYGRFSGSTETINFVSRVLNQYDYYCQL